MTTLPNTSIVLPRRLSTKPLSDTPSSATDKGNEITRDITNVANLSIQNFRNGATDIANLRNLDSYGGTVSNAIFSFVEVANSGYTLSAYDPTTHQLSPEGGQIAQSVLAKMDTLFDYSKGFADKRSIPGIVETALKEVVITGALVNELVLDKFRMPDRISIIPFETINYVSRGDGTKFPRQISSTGENIDLDYPTIFISELHKHANRVYASSMLSASLNNTFMFSEFIEDLRRSVRRSGHARTVLTLNSEKMQALAPEELKGDGEKLVQWLENIRSSVETNLKNLNPEDVLVMYDTAEVEMLKGEGEKADYVPLLNAMSGQLATSLKSSPSILGLRINGSQSLSNTESLVFLKIAKGIQRPVEENLSRLFTLAVRLYGSDTYVKFRFNPINLRPEDELEAFKSMKQQRILTLLSEGFITDEEAAAALGTGPRAPNAPPLSGTGFMRGSKTIDANDASPNADPQGAALQPDTPDKAGGESQ